MLRCTIDYEHDQVFFVSVQDGDDMVEDGGFDTKKIIISTIFSINKIYFFKIMHKNQIFNKIFVFLGFWGFGEIGRAHV